MKRHLLLLLSYCGTLIFCQAQQTFDWESQGISFTLPDDFVEVTNERRTFEAEGDGMEFGLYVFNDETIDVEDIIDLTLELAVDLDLEEIDDAEEIELNGLEGAYVLGYVDGDAVFLLGMIDPDSDTNFYATVTFADDDDVAEDTAFDILESIVRI